MNDLVNPGQVRVLIAEDEMELRELLAAKFRVFGFQVLTSGTGDEAWQKVQDNDELQILITDLRMPKGDGFELLKKCKARNSDKPRVFVISGHSDYTLEELMNEGAEGFISKPFDTKVLLDIVRKSILKTEDRWGMPTSTHPPFLFEMEFDDIQKAIQNQLIQFGRGGFYIRTTQSFPKPGRQIQFCVHAKSGWKMEGIGMVSWIHECHENNERYAGIEICNLKGPSTKNVVEIIAKDIPVAFIPKSPKKAA